MEHLTLSGVNTLFHKSLVSVVEHLPVHVDSLCELPANVKARLLYLMSKRGLISDRNIQQVLHGRLTMLDLSDCDDVSDHSLALIAAHCHSLRKVDLNCSKGSRENITSQGVIDLANGCRFLETLYLRRCDELTDDGMIEVSIKCPQLRYLNIGGCPKITDATLAALGQNCTQLRSVNFSHSKVTDDGVCMLVNGSCGTTLQEIHMSQCCHLTDESVEAVVQFCPSVNILIFSGCPNITDRSRLALEEILGNQSKVKQLTWTVY